MEFRMTLLFLASLFGLSSCSDMKNTEYGNLIFETEYAGLLHNDKLWLYDNGVFKIDMPDLVANGKFKIKGDTIFLDYYKFTGQHSQAYIINNKVVTELLYDNGNWTNSSRDTDMEIKTNKLTSYIKK
jgi:hypothetical protein